MNVETFEKDSLKVRTGNIDTRIFVYSSVVGFLLVFLIVIICLLKKDLYYQNELVIINHEKALLNILPMDLNIIEKNKYLELNNHKYYYNIEKIELINTNPIYYQVTLSIKNELLVNSINSCKILLRKENMLNYIVRIIKGG